MKFVDISGFGHSGKGVITDLLREFDGYQVPHPNFEFNLLRIQGGLIDLQHGLVDNWSPIRSDAAIRRFRKVVRRIGPSATLAKPSTLFLANGMNYDAHFAGRFSELSEEYVRSLIAYEYDTEWPYPLLDESPWKQLVQRVALNLKLRKKFETRVSVAAPIDFVAQTRQYLSALFSTISRPDTRTTVLHNAVEPFCPQPALDLLGDAKLIVVQRDPRDIYASIFVKDDAYNPAYEVSDHWRIKSSFLGAGKINRFVQRQRLFYDRVRPHEDARRVLRLRYEDVVLDYEKTLHRIFKFLGESAAVHRYPGKYFVPSQSARNIGLWKRAPRSGDIRVIEAEMGEYCYFGNTND